MSPHDRAMDLCAQGDALVKAGALDAARALYAEALPLARAEAEAEQTQPSRAILHRSAAWVAVAACDPREAYRLAEAGLSDEGAPEHARQELREVRTVAVMLCMVGVG